MVREHEEGQRPAWPPATTCDLPPGVLHGCGICDETETLRRFWAEARRPGVPLALPPGVYKVTGAIPV